MIAAPTEARVLAKFSGQCFVSAEPGAFHASGARISDGKNATYIPLLLASSTIEPHGPLLAESITSKSIIVFSFLNQFHLSCPRASAVGRSRADLAKPEKIEINALIEIFSLEPI
jgi:hypothetical protein